MSFSQEAHDIPVRGFFVNIASSALPWPSPSLLMIRSYKFFIYLSNNFNAFLVSFLSANCLVRALTISFSLSMNSLSKSRRDALSAF